MKESDYMLAGNLARLRLAYEAVQHCTFLDPKEAGLKTEVARAMWKLIEKLEAQVDRKVRAGE